MGNLQDGVASAKAWWQSKTIIGILIAFIPTIVKAINPELTLDLGGIAEEGFGAAEQIAEAGDQLWVTLTTLFGSLLAVWGRIKAKVV